MSSDLPACPKCNRPMPLARVVPPVAGHPELQSFQCRACREVMTRPVEAAPRDR